MKKILIAVFLLLIVLISIKNFKINLSFPIVSKELSVHYDIPQTEYVDTKYSGVLRKNIQAKYNNVSVLPKNHTRHRMESIAILSYCSYNNDFCKVSRCNHKRYASAYNYTYLNPSSDSDEFHLSKFLLHGTRYKTYSILKYMSSFTWILWIDSDALFMNFDIPIEYWIARLNRKKSNIFIAKDIPGYPFNAGVMLIKSTEWTRDFFKRSINEIVKRSTRDSSQDQPVFFDFWKKNRNYERNNIFIFNQRNLFQAMIKMRELTEESWIVHLTCCKRDQCNMAYYDTICTENCTRTNCFSRSVGRC